MCNVSDAVIKEIIKLGKGTDTQKWDATQIMCKKVFPGSKCVDPSVIPKILPTIIKFIASKAPRVQEEGLFFATAVTTTSSATRTQKQHTKLVIDGGAFPILAKLLSSKHPGVQEMTLRCLGNIATEFPDCVLVHLNTSRNVILKHVESKTPAVCEEALKMLNTVISSDEYLCQEILDLGVLKSVKKAVSRIPSIKLLAIKFIKKMSKCENQIDTIIEEGFVPIILKQINSVTNDDEIKLKSAKIIKNILDKNPEVVPSLINEYKIIPIITRALQSDNDDLLIAVLSILDSIIDNAEFESIFRKFKNNGGLRALQKLIEHDNVEIQELSNKIYSCFDDEHIEAHSGRINRYTSQFDEEVENEEEENEVISPSAAARNQRLLKRSAATVAPQKPNPRSKRARRSLDQTDTEQSVSVAGDHEEENYDERNVFNDFDDLPSRHSYPIEQQQQSQRQPIVMVLPPILPNNSRIEEEAAAEGNENEDVPLNASNNFPPIKCCIPPECFISKYCEQLGLNFIRKEYVNLWSQYELTQISSNSKPTKFLSMADKSAFSCFSVFFTCTEQNAELIWGKINGYFGYNLERLGTLDAIVQMFECRIMVYCNGTWQKYGDWNIQSDDIPLFILQKKEVGNKTIYEIVLSLKN